MASSEPMAVGLAQEAAFEVEGRRIRPVQILKHERHGSGRPGGEQRGAFSNKRSSGRGHPSTAGLSSGCKA
jgi:hypothetical protein